MITYQFIGGSLDGQRFAINNAHVGMTWNTDYRPDRRTEVYVLEADDCFHFQRYGLGFVTRSDEAAYHEDMKQVMPRLSTLLQEFDSILQKHGGPDATQHVVGNWIIRHKDA